MNTTTTDPLTIVHRPGGLSLETCTNAAQTLADLEELVSAGDLSDPGTLAGLSVRAREHLADITGGTAGDVEDLANLAAEMEDDPATVYVRDALSVQVVASRHLGSARGYELDEVRVSVGLGGPNVWHVFREYGVYIEVHAAWDGHHYVDVRAPELAARVWDYVQEVADYV